MVVADYCEVKARSWLVTADRFTGWLSVFYFPQEADTKQFVEIFKQLFLTFGAPQHFSSDDGSQYII